jgi:hypothetical protein
MWGPASNEMRESLLCGFFFSRNVNASSLLLSLSLLPSPLSPLPSSSTTTKGGDKYMPSHIAIAGEQLRFEEEEG